MRRFDDGLQSFGQGGEAAAQEVKFLFFAQTDAASRPGAESADAPEPKTGT
jgi:hypothetical protein